MGGGGVMPSSIGGITYTPMGDHMTTVTIDDQRRWEGIARDWDVGSPTVLTQINTQLRVEFPAEWVEPYKDFVYGFRGLMSAHDHTGVCGQWVAYRRADDCHLYASVPGMVARAYIRGTHFEIPQLFPREKLLEPAGFAELWQAVRESRERLIRLMEGTGEAREVA